MIEHYYGKIGKNKSWGLLANKKIVVYSKQKNAFFALDSISEADKHYVNPSEDVVYFWENGEWNETNFLVETKRENIIGFVAR